MRIVIRVFGLIAIAVAFLVPSPYWTAGARPVLGQTEPGHSGSIRGVVLGDGLPLPRVILRIRSLADPGENGVVTTTDDNGEFSASGLAARAYVVAAKALGYVSDTGAIYRAVCFSGDFITIRLSKGGVISGCVTDEDGAAVVNAVVEATLENGPPLPVQAIRQMLYCESDEQGMYRIFGLPPGNYIVQIESRGFLNAEALVGECRIFYPSSTCANAKPVSVGAGQEVTGIDIQYRSIWGHSLSGEVRNATTDTSFSHRLDITLRSSSNGALAGSTAAGGQDGKLTFDFDGIADGDYALTVDEVRMDTWTKVATATRNVQVKGADLSGLDLALVRVGSISGKLVVSSKNEIGCKSPALSTQDVSTHEASSQEASTQEASTQEASSQEAMIRVTRVEEEGSHKARFVKEAGPSPNGDFELDELEPGDYYIQVLMRDPGLFIQAITLQTPSGNTVASTAGGNMISLARSERKTGLTITVMNGAASLSGRLSESAAVSPRKEGAAVLLVPADLVTSVSTATRESITPIQGTPSGEPQSQSPVESHGTDRRSTRAAGGDKHVPSAPALQIIPIRLASDGTFSLHNIAPGKYFILNAPIDPASFQYDEDDLNAGEGRWLFPAFMRTSAFAAIKKLVPRGAALDLVPCSNRADYDLRF